MTKEEAFIEINKTQDEYVNELLIMIDDYAYKDMKAINFTSATGTGKTKMMSKLINKLPDYYFVITTLSKGQLHKQVRDGIRKDCINENYYVYGSADYKINSLLDAEDIIGRIPNGIKCVWLRDEGHIKTSRFDELLADKCYKIVNFSATNKYSDIKCNFTHTMMLRTVNQSSGSPEDAINKLIEIKKIHSKVPHYNPCAIFRCISGSDELYQRIISAAKKNKLRYIDISCEPYNMAELCEDDNEYDVIINKYKIVEGIDIRRAHVLFMDNQPSNNTTTIQAIGRCRRNALLYSDDIDILAPHNLDLLRQTRECFVFYNISRMKIDTDQEGELCYAFCNHISCEALKTGAEIEVYDGRLINGLYVIELEGLTGKFYIKKDERTGFNVVEPNTYFYDKEEVDSRPQYIFLEDSKIKISNIRKIVAQKNRYGNNWGHEKDSDTYYPLYDKYVKTLVEVKVPDSILAVFNDRKEKYTLAYIQGVIANRCLDIQLLNKKYIDVNDNELEKYVESFKRKYSGTSKYVAFRQLLSKIRLYEVRIDGFIYKLKDLCSKRELLFLKYFLVKKKEAKYSDVDVESSIKSFCETKRKYYRYRFNYSINEIIKSINTKELSDQELLELVNKYLNDESNRKSSPLIFDKLKEIKEAYTKKELFSGEHIDREWLEFIHFFINEKKEGTDELLILSNIKKIMTYMYEFNLSRSCAEVDSVSYIILSENIDSISDGTSLSKRGIGGIHLSTDYSVQAEINISDIDDFFNRIEHFLSAINYSRIMYMHSALVYVFITECINVTRELLNNNIVETVEYSYAKLFEQLTQEDKYHIKHKHIKVYKPFGGITIEELEKIENIAGYKKVINDYESAIIGVDEMRPVREGWNDTKWIEEKTVTSKIGGYNKLNRYISNKYKKELEEAKNQLFTGENDFSLDKKCNSVIGYCVEYYSKYLLYGEKYLRNFIEQALKEAKDRDGIINDAIIVRACMLKYKEMMSASFGVNVTKYIKTISIQTLLDDKNIYFINLVTELGNKTAKYVKKVLYDNREAINNVDANLSINHITGLADYITKDTILDVKVRNNIDENCVRQVLGYHYLSTKRSDLCIKKVIVYDAVSDKAVEVNISPENVFTYEKQ